VAVAACEQCGGNRVPRIHEVLSLTAWIRARAATRLAANAAQDQSLLLSLRPGTLALRDALDPGQPTGAVTFLSGPEGGLSASEEDAALACGFMPVTLGPRVLRSETAALAALMALRV
jgi:16S rRNA (uracil1498-N3)-methyltransferase